MAATITAVTFADDNLPGLESLIPPGTGQCRVQAEFSDGSSATVFVYYRDELTFTGQELIGLTAEQARQLHYQRDLEWLRS